MHFRNEGCKGGDFDWAFRYLMEHYLMLESDYPFTSGATGDDSTDCQYSELKLWQHKVKVKDTGYFPADKNQMKIMKARIQQQPVVTAIAANN